MTTTTQEVELAVARLQNACDAAYEAHPNSCSHAVWYILRQIHAPNEPYRQANDLISHMTAHWREVDLERGFALANEGRAVVGGKKETGNGHVIAIYPGEKIHNGGYQYFWKKGNRYMMMPRRTLYPRALSTSIGSWPGAMSRGDKTVWDPWANDANFANVRFWTP
jgi:hypothetical protein